MNNRIREIIEKKGLKVSYVIAKSGLAKSYFYDVMNGKSIPSLFIARKIAEVIGVPLDELFPDENSIEKEVS